MADLIYHLCKWLFIAWLVAMPLALLAALIVLLQ